MYHMFFILFSVDGHLEINQFQKIYIFVELFDSGPS